MDLNRFQRILATRWWVLLGVALVAAWVAGNFTEVRNRQMPEREALASITFFRQFDDITGAALEERLTEAETLATEVNADLLSARVDPLAPWSIAEIAVDDQGNHLQFIGRGETDAEAEAIATRMRQNFLDSGFLEDTEELESRLQAINARLAELKVLVDQLEVPPLTTEQRVRAAVLNTEIEALRGHYGALSLALVQPPDIGELADRTPESIEAEREAVRARLVQLETERASIVAPQEQEETQEAVVYQLQYEQLQEVYRELFLRRLQLESEINEVVAYAANLEPVPPIFQQALGLLAGLLVGIVGLVVADRVRRPLWSPTEVEGLGVLAELPPRGLRVPPDRPWYLAVPANARKAGIQTLRATVEGLWGPEGATLGICGIGAQAEDVQELAADLATSMTTSAHSVLLVDAGLDHPSIPMEFGSGQPTLSNLLRMPVKDVHAAKATIKQLLLEAAEVAPGLVSLPAGAGAADPADIMAGHQLALVLEAAKEIFDAVIVAGTDVNHPITHVLSQRVDAMLLLGAAGHTTVSSLEFEFRELANRRARLLGLVLLTKSPSRLRRVLSALMSGRGGRDRGEEPPAPPRQPESSPRARELAGARSRQGAELEE
ncbi:MAG: hypothetical protein M3N51_09640 [Actinomycetota bacterium]|nr:hypothetical protein [Actinomycetota bacterium]